MTPILQKIINTKSILTKPNTLNLKKINMYITLQEKSYYLNIGDRVVVPITSLGISMHHAIFIGNYNNQPHFIENKSGYGVRLISARQFFLENPTVSRIEPFEGSNAQRTELLKNAFSKLGGRYDLLLYNCEHFANELQHRKAFSLQVRNSVFILLTYLVVASILND